MFFIRVGLPIHSNAWWIYYANTNNSFRQTAAIVLILKPPLNSVAREK